jgi:hypothetical protein
VPYDLNDEDIPEDWTCENNVWDEEHQSCSVPQALSDEQIDEILALQEVHWPSPSLSTRTSGPIKCSNLMNVCLRDL